MEKTTLPLQIKLPLLETLSKRGSRSDEHLKQFKKIISLFDEDIAEDIKIIIVGETYTSEQDYEDRQYGELTYLIYYKDRPSIEELVELFIEKGFKKNDLIDYLLIPKKENSNTNSPNSSPMYGDWLMEERISGGMVDYFVSYDNWVPVEEVELLYERVALQMNNIPNKPHSIKIF